MPAVDSRSKHELCRRTTKPCNQRPSVPVSMHRQYRV